MCYVWLRRRSISGGKLSRSLVPRPTSCVLSRLSTNRWTPSRKRSREFWRGKSHFRIAITSARATRARLSIATISRKDKVTHRNWRVESCLCQMCNRFDASLQIAITNPRTYEPPACRRNYHDLVRHARLTFACGNRGLIRKSAVSRDSGSFAAQQSYNHIYEFLHDPIIQARPCDRHPVEKQSILYAVAHRTRPLTILEITLLSEFSIYRNVLRFCLFIYFFSIRTLVTDSSNVAYCNEASFLARTYFNLTCLYVNLVNIHVDRSWAGVYTSHIQHFHIE